MGFHIPFRTEVGTSPRRVDSPARLGSHTAKRSAPTGVELFTEGDALYAAMLESIRGARLTVRMESYLFVNDEIGQEFAEALAERAQSGVDVRLHLDAAGAFWSLSAGRCVGGYDFRTNHLFSLP